MAILAKDPDAMVLAGGQSLIPAMNLRLANPSRLVDLRNIDGLNEITIADGSIKVGAMVRHRDLELDRHAKAANPLIAETLARVAHVPIRNRGTVVGSLCHADAAAEMPLILVLCDGSVTAQGSAGTREIAAADYFQFHMTTSRAADEIIVAANFPTLPPGAGHAFDEFARRRGDYAIAGVGAVVELDGGGRAARVSLGACGIGAKPVRLTDAESALTGTVLSEADLTAAGERAKSCVTAADDMHATADYRKHLLATLVRRVVSLAASRATRD